MDLIVCRDGRGDYVHLVGGLFRSKPSEQAATFEDTAFVPTVVERWGGTVVQHDVRIDGPFEAISIGPQSEAYAVMVEAPGWPVPLGVDARTPLVLPSRGPYRISALGPADARLASDAANTEFDHRLCLHFWRKAPVQFAQRRLNQRYTMRLAGDQDTENDRTFTHVRNGRTFTRVPFMGRQNGVLGVALDALGGTSVAVGLYAILVERIETGEDAEQIRDVFISPVSLTTAKSVADAGLTTTGNQIFNFTAFADYLYLTTNANDNNAGNESQAILEVMD